MTEAQLEVFRKRLRDQRTLRPGASFAELELLLDHIDDLEQELDAERSERDMFEGEHETCVEPPDDLRVSLAELWLVIPGAASRRAVTHLKESA